MNQKAERHRERGKRRKAEGHDETSCRGRKRKGANQVVPRPTLPPFLRSPLSATEWDYTSQRPYGTAPLIEMGLRSFSREETSGKDRPFARGGERSPFLRTNKIIEEKSEMSSKIFDRFPDTPVARTSGRNGKKKRGEVRRWLAEGDRPPEIRYGRYGGIPFRDPRSALVLGQSKAPPAGHRPCSLWLRRNGTDPSGIFMHPRG